MNSAITLFISMFTTLLAIINPLEAIPVFLGLVEGKADVEKNKVARQSCFYALLLAFFFLLFGTLLLRLFGVPLEHDPGGRRDHSHSHRFSNVQPATAGESGSWFWQRPGRQAGRCRVHSPCHADHVRPRGHRHDHRHGLDRETIQRRSESPLSPSLWRSSRR